MSNQITVPLNEIFVVFAQSGRFSGTAYVRAKTKKLANQYAQNGGWLENGRVVKSETKNILTHIREYEELRTDDEIIQYILDECEIGDINKLSEEGKWVEIEWGT